MLKFGLEIHFGVIQNHIAAIFEILIFRHFSGGQSSKFSENGENLNFDPLKIAKNQNLKNHSDKILYHPMVYLQNKFQHQRICRFLDPLRFM